MVMASKGWVTLHRSIQDHWLWDDKPFSKGQAWLDLVMMASHKDNKFVLGNELIQVSRGQFITSELKLMERWGWGKSKTRAFLQLLQDDGMIVKKSDRKKTTVNIVNYSDYQDLETTDKPRTDHNQTDNRLITDTINNENNENNENKVYSPDFENFYSLYPNPKGKAQTYKNWQKVIRKYEPELILQSAKKYKKSVEGTDKSYITTSYNFLGQKAVYMDYLPGNGGEVQKAKKKESVVRELSAEDLERLFAAKREAEMRGENQ